MKTKSGYIELGYFIVGSAKNGLQRLAWRHGVELQCIVSTGIFSRRIDWKVTGEEKAVDAFYRDALSPRLG